MRERRAGDGPLEGVIVRAASPGDMAAIADIYGRHVAVGTASFEMAVPDVDEMLRRYHSTIADGYPYLVAADERTRVVGYAYAGPYRARPAYRHTVENSVYVDAGVVGRGVGGTLLAALIEACTARGYRQMIAIIGGADNAASLNLHAAHGFNEAGRLVAVGRKLGCWLDTVLMQRALGDGARTPPARE